MKTYEVPTIEIIILDQQDIILGSNGPDNLNRLDIGDWDLL